MILTEQEDKVPKAEEGPKEISKKQAAKNRFRVKIGGGVVSA